jgi:hypothetical protein
MEIGENFFNYTEEEQKEYSKIAEWCGANGCMIVEISPAEHEVTETDFDGNKVTKTVTARQFQIQAIPEPSQEELIKREIAELKAYLSETDYVAIKIAEGEATADEYAEVLAKRKEARARINELEGELA